MRYRELAKRLKKLGCKELPRKSKGSHHKWYNPETRKIVPIPNWGNKDLKTGTLRHIINQLDLNWDNFKQL